VLYLFFVLYPPFPYTSPANHSASSTLGDALSDPSSLTSLLVGDDYEQRQYRQQRHRTQFERAKELEASVLVWIRQQEDRFAEAMQSRRKRMDEQMVAFMVCCRSALR
jgi:hypothetical protein